MNGLEQAPVAYAYVDGSYNASTRVYGYGGFLVYEKDGKNDKIILQGSGNNKEYASSRNVAGEVFGCVAAICKAKELKLPGITIYYDYKGIEYWATKKWKRNKPLTKEYARFIELASMEPDPINITFVHVKGHSGVAGNEEADALAKEAVGL